MWCQNEIPCSNFRKQRGRGRERRKRESWVRARRVSQHGAAASGPVRANLADQTGAKSPAFVRVNSIHELSIFPISLSLPLSLSSSPFFRLYIIPWLCVSHTPPGFLPPRAECFSRDIHDRSNRWARDNGPLDTFRSLYGPPFPWEIKSWWFSDRDFSGDCSIYSRQDTPSCCRINSSRVGQSICRSTCIFRKQKMSETLSFYI